MTPAQGRAYQYLRTYADQHGGLPIMTDAARALGITYPTLSQHLDALHAKGYLHVERRGVGRPPLVQFDGGRA
jgi:predicted ArsR family transcriptional regulator